ncbi:hypothetical protein COU60_05210 [Candidatus Pacearchaeota archaeon CG10_big_fil_rev_8_21_14_0_10_34_76]|nr:MAG: hypothetical protein COU60_05210 [Candidatus Pacearchaeota archaeon CG10_big_fil_rev_8_21_14_0_10_34_76]
MKIGLKINSLEYEDNISSLENLEINLNGNSLLLIKGDTGSGKTTLLKVFCGLIPFIQEADFKGNITIDGKKRGFKFLKGLSCFCSQEPENQFIMSNIENEVFFNLNSREKERANRLLSVFDLERFKDKSVKDLSTGQRKLISLIPILASDKPLKILDEPTANLDIENKNKLKLILSDLKKDNLVIISTHDSCFDNISNKTVYLNNLSEIAKPIVKFNLKKGEKIISLEEISVVSPDNFFSLENISLEISQGDIFGIFGSNGSGKTTLINLISGKIKQDSGKLDIKKGVKISLVTQEPEKQLFANSVLEEVMLSGNLNEKQAVNQIKRCGLDSMLNKHPFFLSRGQKQLLLIISALSSNPDIIIFDELLTGIDKENGRKIIELMKEYYEKNNPAIILTDQDEKVFERIISNKINLDGKRLDRYSEGLVHEVYRKGNLVYKKVKDNFEEFKNKEHFHLEEKILNLLLKKGLPSAEVKGIQKLGDNYFLVENFIEGYQKEKRNLNSKEMAEILRFVAKVHKIKIKKYGEINSDLIGTEESWRNFILKRVKSNFRYLKSKNILNKHDINSLNGYLTNNLKEINYEGVGSLIITDLNPLNFFFKNEKLIGAIDIDHPLSGDSFYEWGALKWYHDDLFDFLLKNYKFNFDDIKKIFIYELMHAVSVIVWMNKNNLDIIRDVQKLKETIERIESDLITLSNLTLLVIKPEIIDKKELIKNELSKKGYEVIREENKQNFSKVVGDFYMKDYPNHYKMFKEAYLNCRFGDKFSIFILRKKSGNSIKDLKKEVGHYKNYQKKKDDSLRSVYGLDSSKNYKSEGFEMYFNGFHKINDLEDFIYHLKLLKIRLI